MPIGDEQWIQDQLAQLATQRPAAMPTGTPDDGTSPSWTGLLGSVLGGGQTPGYKLRGGEADTSGNRALLNFGIQTLLASGPAPVRPDVLSAVASGLQGAQSSMDVDQRRAQAAAVAQQGFADKQQEMRLAALKEALPLLKLQQEQRALAGLKGGATSTAAAPGGSGFTGDKEKDRAIIVGRESGGDPTALNYVAKADPSAYERGATASGKYQFVNSTWAEGLKLAGIDPAQYPTARSAPEAVQDKVFDVVYAKYGTKPWEKGTRDWVKGPDGKYQLAAVAPSAPAAVGATPSAAPGGGVAARTGGTNVAGPGAGATAPAPAPAPAVVDLDGPRPLPPTGPGSPVATPASLANTPLMVPAPAPSPAPASTATSGVVPPGAAPPPAPAMATPPPFQMRPLTPTEAAATSYDLPPDMAAEIARDKQNAPDVASFRAAEDKERAAKLARRNAADTERLRIEASERTEHNAQWREQQKQLAAIEAARIKEEGETKRLHDTAAETRLTNREAVVNGINQKGLEKTTAELAHAISVERQMEGFRSLSESVGTPGWMNTTKFPGTDQSISERLQQLGVAQDDLAGFQQLQQGMVDITRTLREGVQMGAMSDKDLDFIQRMGPTQWMDKDTRLAAVDYIQKAYRAKRKFSEEVNSEMARGTNYGDALSKANEKVKDFVPMVPRELADNFDNPNVQAAERLAWARKENVRPGTLFHFPNGDVRIMRRPPPKEGG